MKEYLNRIEKYLEKLGKEKIDCDNQIFSWQKELDSAKELLDIIDENSSLVFWQKRRILTAESIILNLKLRVEQIELEQEELKTQIKVLSSNMKEISPER